MKLPVETHIEIEKLLKGRKHVDLTIGILKDGKKEIFRIQSEGFRNDEEDPVYPVGSICKPFTASLLAKYVSENKLDLDAPLSDYIEGLPDRYYPSLRRLATHSSGFKTEPYNLITTIPFFVRMNREGGLFHTNPFRGYPDREQMMEILKKAKLKDQVYPFVYSNFGMSVLGYIVGQVNGEGFWKSLNDYIHDDLGLSHTYLGNIEMKGYDRKDQPCSCWQWEESDIIAPAGALNSNVSDLLKFAQINLDGSRPYLAMCHEYQGECEGDSDSGLAWRLDHKLPVSWHTGAAGAFHAWLGFNRETGTAAAVGINYGLVNAEEIGFSILRNEDTL